MPKPVSLTVHKNTRARRRAKDVRRAMAEHIRSTTDLSLDGFVVLSWTSDGQHQIDWATGTQMRSEALGHYVTQAVARRVASIDADRKLFPPKDDA